jgi:hypothetical protein
MGKYYCRLCYSSNNWLMPSRAAAETSQTHFGNFGFAWEEWNFNFSTLINGMKYGWIEGFWTEWDSKTGRARAKAARPLVEFGSHDVILYTVHRGERHFVGMIRGCEHIDQTRSESRLPTEIALVMAQQARAIQADVRKEGSGWTYYPILVGSSWDPLSFAPSANIMFDPANYQRWQPIPAPIKSDRYRPIRVHGDDNKERDWDRLIESAVRVPTNVTRESKK